MMLNDTSRPKRMNSAIAGYHMLMMLAEVDGNSDGEEGLIIVDYLKTHFPLPVNMDNEIAVLSTLRNEDFATHFSKAAMDFYYESTPEEREDFLKFAQRLVKADTVVNRTENVYFKLVQKLWSK